MTPKKTHVWQHADDKLSGICRHCKASYVKEALQSPILRVSSNGKRYIQRYRMAWKTADGGRVKGNRTPPCGGPAKVKSRYERLLENADAD